MLGMTETAPAYYRHESGGAHATEKIDGALLSELKRRILAALPDGGVTIDVIALRLGFSERTLQRRLQAARLNFQQLVEQLRFDAACRYLQQGDLPLTEIGYQLGYSEPSAFSRAFRRWSGVSPLVYRRSLV